MNYFFFLDTDDPQLIPSIEVFNRPPAKRLSKDKLITKNIIAFYAQENQWFSHFVAKIEPNRSLLIKKTDLPSHYHNKSVFLCMSDYKYIEKNQLVDENYMNSSPAWRANIKISSKFNSTSYQGEYPHRMTEKKISLVSCTPMIQTKDNIKSFFYLVNLKNKPYQNLFKVKIMTIKKEIIKEILFKTNKINYFNLNTLTKNNKNLTYIFSSHDEGGIPIYFSKNNDNSSFSLEHTHPPTEYTFGGNRFLFQKKKKSFWHN